MPEPMILEVLTGKDAGLKITVPASGAVLGRGSDCEIVFKEPTLSRKHCRIIPETTGYVLEDLNSRSGLFVNGQKVSSSPLKQGDEIKMGCFCLRVLSLPMPQVLPARDIQDLHEYQDVETCPKCGQRFFPSKQQSCPCCGWRMPIAVSKSPQNEKAIGKVQPNAGRRLLSLGGLIILLLFVVGGGGLLMYRQISKWKIESEEQRKNDIVHQYQLIVENAKSSIRSKNLKMATESLKTAVALPESLDKTEATSLLKEIETVEAPVEKVLQSMSDVDFSTLCDRYTLPPSYRLTYPPLNLQYQEKVLAGSSDERSRRNAASVEAERNKKGNVKPELSALSADADLQTATADGVPTTAGTASKTTTEMRDKVGFVTGAFVRVNITDCRGGQVVWRVVTSTDSEGKRVTNEFRHNCSDIISIAFGVPDAKLEKMIVKEALSVGNGVLAYDVACNAILNNDPKMRFVSEDPRLGQASAAAKTARNAYISLSAQVTHAETRLAFLDANILSIYSEAGRANGLDSACAEIIRTMKANHQKGGQEAADALRVQQDLMRSEQASLRTQLPNMRKERDEAKTAQEKAQAALDAICKDILQKAFSVTVLPFVHTEGPAAEPVPVPTAQQASRGSGTI